MRDGGYSHKLGAFLAHPSVVMAARAGLVPRPDLWLGRPLNHQVCESACGKPSKAVRQSVSKHVSKRTQKPVCGHIGKT